MYNTLYTVFQKSKPPTHGGRPKILTNFQNSFSVKLSDKFAAK